MAQLETYNLFAVRLSFLTNEQISFGVGLLLNGTQGKIAYSERVNCFRSHTCEALSLFDSCGGHGGGGSGNENKDDV